MSKFAGFSPGKMRFTSIPAQFFTELLPKIDHLGEMKVTLYALWQLDRMEGSLRYLLGSDFSDDKVLMQSFGEESNDTLSDSLSRCVARGTLLSSNAEVENKSKALYFLNTERGQAAIAAIKNGEWQLSDEPHFPIELAGERPNIFRLYEENIGPLTPLIADALRAAEDIFSSYWIEEAFTIAVENNVRKWRYIEAILKSWKEEGKDERTNRGDSKKDRRKYVEGEFSQFIEH
ncbi:MAG: DnaD domain protein [Chloroflexota bacterium]